MSAPQFNSTLAVDVFNEYGALSLETWAQVCVQRGVFSEEFVATATVKHARETLRKFSQEEDASTGLPRFGQTTRKDETGEPLYAPPTLWDRDDALLHIEVRLKNRNDQHFRLVRLVEWFEDRFGGTCPFRPEVERLPDLQYDGQVAESD